MSSVWCWIWKAAASFLWLSYSPGAMLSLLGCQNWTSLFPGHQGLVFFLPSAFSRILSHTQRILFFLLPFLLKESGLFVTVRYFLIFWKSFIEPVGGLPVYLRSTRLLGRRITFPKSLCSQSLSSSAWLDYDFQILKEGAKRCKHITLILLEFSIS